MNDNIFNLFMLVIKAAREGRYVYGNGAQWYIMDNGVPMCVDTINGQSFYLPSYKGMARVDMATADALESFLMSAQAEDTYKVEYRYSDAKSMIADAVRNNNLCFTNGNQWYAKVGTYCVVIVPLGVRASHVMVEVMNQHRSWMYMRNNPRPCILTESTKKYMNF